MFVNCHKGLNCIDYFSLNGLARVLIIVLTILLALLCIVLCFVFFFLDVSITLFPCRIETGKLSHKVLYFKTHISVTRNGSTTHSIEMKIRKLLSLSFFSTSTCLGLSVSSKKRTSLVTGANGYLGREIVHELLREGTDNPVICLVRSTRVATEQNYWSARSNCVLVMPYDMLDGGATLTRALESIGTTDDDKDSCLYHVASVFGPTENHQQTALDNVEGTVNVVTALANVKNCRLVLTSSMAAVRGTGQPPSNGDCYTNLDWNTMSILGTNWGASYQWGKAESERRAWECSKELGVAMTAMCPSFIFGPPHDGTFRSTSYSIELVRQWNKGDSEVQSRLCADVRDVAKAHVAAGRLNTAIGQRFLVSAETRLTSKNIAEALKRVSITPEKIIHDSRFDRGVIKIGSREVIATDRLKTELGVELRSVTETFEDMGRALLQGEMPLI
jgi:nucleoside-diphosphate-sugar epimerase